MTKKEIDVQKSDIGFLEHAKQFMGDCRDRLNVKSTRTKTTLRGYGVNYSRETETRTGTVDNGGCDEGH